MLEIGINILSIYAQEDFLQYQFSINALGINISNGKKKNDKIKNTLSAIA